MWIKTNAQNFFASLSRSRKILLGVLVLLMLLLYLWPSWPSFHRTRIKLDQLELCVDQKLQPYRDLSQSFDVVFGHSPGEDEQPGYLPFVGNGYIGVTVDSTKSLYVKNNRVLAMPIPYYPVIRTNIEGYQSKEATVINFKNGEVSRFQVFKTGANSCASATNRVYAHRARPSILVQDIMLHNPSGTSLSITVDHIGPSDWKQSSTKLKKIQGKDGVESSCTVTTGTVALPGDSQQRVIVVSIATIKTPEMITVGPSKAQRLHVVSVAKYSENPVSQKDVPSQSVGLETAALAGLESALRIDKNLLHHEHATIWNQLWSSGFGISYSRAAGALNGDKINATIYYVMSHMRSPIQEYMRSDRDKYTLQKLLYFPDRCYEGHHTLQNSKMWSDLTSESDIIDDGDNLAYYPGQAGLCHHAAGADGAIQAMMLSFGALKFSNSHLEFNTHPKDLHRDYFFRRINYGNNTHVNISVIVGDDNKAVLSAALDRNDKPYYACDAGCLDNPVNLRKKSSQFPVKLTDPLTAILYITADKQHMQELKHAIHVREIAEAPAHEHHVMALHRHGHHYGGLPVLFWVSISFLILVFHLFLFKLIFNEYCQSSSDRFVRGKYNL